jgi:hypothetical protein
MGGSLGTYIFRDLGITNREAYNKREVNYDTLI